MDKYASSYQMFDFPAANATDVDAAAFNARWQDINARLSKLETSGWSSTVYVKGPVATGITYALVYVPIALDSLSVGITCGSLPGGANLVVDVLKGTEPSGGAPGTSIWASAGDRPTITPTTYSGKSGFKAATQQTPVAAGSTLGIVVVAAGAGPAEDLTVVIYGEPSA